MGLLFDLLRHVRACDGCDVSESRRAVVCSFISHGSGPAYRKTIQRNYPFNKVLSGRPHGDPVGDIFWTACFFSLRTPMESLLRLLYGSGLRPIDEYHWLSRNVDRILKRELVQRMSRCCGHKKLWRGCIIFPTGYF